MSMTWLNLAFLHWRVPAEALEHHLPAGLTLETFDGSAWLGVVPFEMADVRARGLPRVPGIHRFLELNLRTYVTDGVRPGVWFFSLDCENPLAVRGARTAFHLPYFDARMGSRQRGDLLEYRSERTHLGQAPARFRGEYGPVGEAFTSTPGTLEHWLTERYCLYSASRPGRCRSAQDASKSGRVFRGEIRHQPWSLQAAEAHVFENTLAQPLGINLPRVPDAAHFARRLEVQAWLLGRVGGLESGAQ